MSETIMEIHKDLLLLMDFVLVCLFWEGLILIYVLDSCNINLFTFIYKGIGRNETYLNGEYSLLNM